MNSHFNNIHSRKMKIPSIFFKLRSFQALEMTQTETLKFSNEKTDILQLFSKKTDLV